MKEAQGMVDVGAGIEGQFLEVFPLDSTRSSNVLGMIALILVSPLALLATGAALAVFPKIFSSWEALAGEVALVALALGVDLMVYRIFREAFPGRCYLGLTADSLVLSHSLLLRRPLEIPLTQIERIAVSSPTSKGFWESKDFALEKEERGLTWVASEEETQEALDVTTRFFLPLASHVQTDEPNVAVVMNEAIDLTEHRRKPISSGDIFVRRLCDVEQARGFFVRLMQPDAAERAFQAKGLLRKLDGEQASLIDPSKQDSSRFGKWRRRRVIGQVIGVLLLAHLVWEFFDSLMG